MSSGDGNNSRQDDPSYQQGLEMGNKIAQQLQESCLVKGAISSVMGGFLGAAIGIIMPAFDSPVPNAPEDNRPTGAKVKEALKSSAKRAGSWGKNFAIMGGIYATTECGLEKVRAKSDIYNSLMAGCATGGIIAVKAGPQAMGFGCATFAAFSAAIDMFMHSDD